MGVACRVGKQVAKHLYDTPPVRYYQGQVRLRVDLAKTATTLLQNRTLPSL